VADEIQSATPAAQAKAVAKAAAKRALDVAFGAKVSLLRLTGAVDFPVPPNHSLRVTSSVTVRHYYVSGLTTLLPIVTSAMTFGADFDKPIDVLDFGCGVGRQLLHLGRMFPKVRAHGCDVNHDSIAYVKRAFPAVAASVNSFDPPLPYADNSFDVIYSVSTFSHFSEADAVAWLRELQRVARPGGVLCLTFNSVMSLSRAHAKGQRQEYSVEQLLQEGRWFDADAAAWQADKAAEAVAELSGSMVGITRLYGEMHYAPEAFAALAREQGFEVLAMLPGIIDRYQDLLVLRAPA
jgi:ubiquinone/menaquinone biosynthesis C-methylase UbiE